MKKLISLLMALSLILGVCACASAEDKTYNVGILQLIQHPALDQATQGFKDALTEKLMGRDTFRGVSPVDPFCGKEYMSY